MVWTVETAPDLALQRLMARNGMSEEQARMRLEAQMSNAQRAARAQRIIPNSGTLAHLNATVASIWRETTRNAAAV
jgi:dephospho-CoA kinase